MLGRLTEAGPPYTYSVQRLDLERPRLARGDRKQPGVFGLGSLTAGATDHLRVTLTLPSGAGNTLQNQTSTISYAFNGTQRTATNK